MIIFWTYIPTRRSNSSCFLVYKSPLSGDQVYAILPTAAGPNNSGWYMCLSTQARTRNLHGANMRTTQTFLVSIFSTFSRPSSSSHDNNMQEQQTMACHYPRLFLGWLLNHNDQLEGIESNVDLSAHPCSRLRWPLFFLRIADVDVQWWNNPTTGSGSFSGVLWLKNYAVSCTRVACQRIASLKANWVHQSRAAHRAVYRRVTRCRSTVTAPVLSGAAAAVWRYGLKPSEPNRHSR